MNNPLVHELDLQLDQAGEGEVSSGGKFVG